MKDYDSVILYQLGKANVVADTLNTKGYGHLGFLFTQEDQLIEEFVRMKLNIVKPNW